MTTLASSASCARQSHLDAMSNAVHSSIMLMEYSRLTEHPSQARDSPIIVGERYELAEAVATNCTAPLYSGFLAKPEYHGALLPMSDYGKSSDADLTGKSFEITVDSLKEPMGAYVTSKHKVPRLTPALQDTRLRGHLMDSPLSRVTMFSETSKSRSTYNTFTLGEHIPKSSCRQPHMITTQIR